MVKTRISKKLHNKYTKFDDGSRFLNNDDGLRWVEITFKFNQDMNTYEANEYLMCLEMYLNDREILTAPNFINYFQMGNMASCIISIKENEINKFNKIYFDFKSDYKNIMEKCKNEAKKGTNL